MDPAELEPQTQAWDVLQPQLPAPADAAPARAAAAVRPARAPLRELQWQGPPIPAPVPTADHKRYYQAVRLQVAVPYHVWASTGLEMKADQLTECILHLVAGSPSVMGQS